MNALTNLTAPARDLVSSYGKVDTNHQLFRCEAAVLARNTKSLLGEYENSRAALCQHVAVAYLRIQNGDIDISWDIWCSRFLVRANGKPYSTDTVKLWLRIGMQPDVEKAWAAHKEMLTASVARSNSRRDARQVISTVKLNRITNSIGKEMADKVAALPSLHLGESKTQRQNRQYGVLLAAWHAAEPEVQQHFRKHVAHLS